jgi:chromosome segregation protein
MAIARTKTPPFCLFDEVETSLDESNLERFSELLVRFSEDFQIMAITHRRPTMEAADTLIGITMQTKGVSAALAVKLDQVVD